jgi:hypothetical protein
VIEILSIETALDNFIPVEKNQRKWELVNGRALNYI